MTKIWQVDFTTYSGVTDVLYDLVGTQHLAFPSGTLNKQDPLPGFNLRRGQLFSANANLQAYRLRDGASIDLTNASFTASYNYRTFSLWINPVNMGNSVYWEAAAGSFGNIWGGAGVANNVYTGLASTLNGNTLLVKSNNSILLTYDGAALPNGWHHIAISVDRLTPQIKLFIDGQEVSSVGSLMTTILTSEVIGDTGVNNENSFYLAEAATYDTILTQSEVQAIYDSGLKDLLTTSGVPYQSLSGTAYGLDGLPVSGASVYCIFEPTKSIESYTTTSGDGYYYLDLPYSGAYTLVTTLPPYGGSRSVPLVAASGSVFFF